MAVILNERELPEILQNMIKNEESRCHLLFLGPPGSGKTTAAQSYATALHGKSTNKFASLLFLNSSDERSLDTIRQKIYPFVESRMQSLFFEAGKLPPKLIIFDEAETLTDQAQCALRTLLHRSTKDVIVIFICNSLSHIHPQIINKFMVLPFNPTNSKQLHKILNVKIPRLDSLYRRGDIRFFKQCPQQNKSVTSFLFKILHTSSKDDLYSIINEPGTPIRERVTWFLLFIQSLISMKTADISLWSAVTSSDTHVYLEESYLSDLLFKMWSSTMLKLLEG
jgi:predicted AAA+ superfamily ATPase